MSEKIKAVPSSGNVFADLGLKDAEERLAKAELAIRMAYLYGFSTDQLIRFLTALGQDVEIVVRDRPRRRRNAKGSLTVRAA